MIRKPSNQALNNMKNMLLFLKFTCIIFFLNMNIKDVINISVIQFITDTQLG